jgi:hypothetical protein
MPDPDWSGIESIVFQVTDPGLKFAEDPVTFVQVKTTIPDQIIGSVLIGRPDSVMFTLSTPTDFTVVSPQILPSSSSVIVKRADGGAIDDDIPPSSHVDYWVVWNPTDTGDTPGVITIASTSLDNAEEIYLSGKAVSFVLVPDLANHDFGNVNSLDKRAADTLQVNVNVSTNIGGTFLGMTFEGSTNDFSILAPQIGDSLQDGFSLEMTILSHPRSVGQTNSVGWILYSIDLNGSPMIDSLDLISLSAIGVEPGCVVIQDSLDFYGRKIETTHSLPFTVSNISTVHEVIDSIYFDSNEDIFWIDPALQWPLFLPPGDTELTVYFRAQAESLYTANMIIIDSISTGDCDPPVVQGIGTTGEAHWGPDIPRILGLVDICESSRTVNYRIDNRIVGLNLVVDDVIVDSSGWFIFYPDLATIVGSTFSPAEDILFDSISFVPQDILEPTSFRMKLIYHVDTANAPIDTVGFSLVDLTGACAGILDQPSNLIFGSTDVGSAGTLDTIVLSNTGLCDLVFDSFSIDNGDFLLEGFTLPLTIIAGEEQRLEVRFMPSSDGVIEGHLAAYHDGFVSPFDPQVDCPRISQTIVNLAGTGSDASPPSIDDVPYSECGRLLDVYVSDIGVGVEDVSISWKKGNADGGFITTVNSPELITTNHWQLRFSESDLPTDSSNILGYEIRIIAVDGAGNADTALLSIAGCIPGDVDGGSMISAGKWLGKDGLDSLWHLVSFPGDLASYSVSDIFGQFSNMQPTHNVSSDSWRLYQYRDGSFDALITNDPTATIEPGRGYWFRHIMDLDTLRLDPTGMATTWPTISPFEISLSYGWNLIGNPYLFPVFINDTLIDNDSLSSFVRQGSPASPGGRHWWEVYNLSSTLPEMQPWQGYAIWCENPGGYPIYLDPHYTPDKGPLNGQVSWFGSISLSSETEAMGQVEFGIHPEAGDGPDIADVRSIKFFNKQSGLSISNEKHGSFIRDIRSESDLQIWQLDISGEGDRPITFLWSVPSVSDPGKMVVLYDAVTRKVIDMSTPANHRIVNPSQMPNGRFSILLGEIEAVKSAIDENPSPVPITFQLYQNFPNPFNPSTIISYDLPGAEYVTLDLYNILGQRVVRLVENLQAAGSYQVAWDSRDDNGRRVSSGIYLARLSTSSHTSTIKMSLLK